MMQNINTLLNQISRGLAYQETLEFKNSILKYNTYKVRIEFHENQISKLGASDTFELEGFENLFNVVNIYNYKNTGIKKITIMGVENNQYETLKVKTFKGNYQEDLSPKNYIFNEFVATNGAFKL